jgi:hypothetical protein
MEHSEALSLKLSLVGHGTFPKRAKVFAIQQIREKEQDNFCFSFGRRSAFGTHMHIQSLHV